MTRKGKLRGLTKQEFSQLLLSVGRTPKEQRPLSPVEVGQYCQKAETVGGHARDEITFELYMSDKGMVPKFIRLLELDPSVQHLVEWGHSNDGAIAFSAAALLVRFDKSVQKNIAKKIMEHRLTKTELTSIIQLVTRSQQSPAQCVARIVKRRPITVVRHVIIGSVVGKKLQTHLQSRTQKERDQLAQQVFAEHYPDLKHVTVKLGPKRFTVIGGSLVATAIANDKDFEATISQHLEQPL